MPGVIVHYHVEPTEIERVSVLRPQVSGYRDIPFTHGLLRYVEIVLHLPQGVVPVVHDPSGLITTERLRAEMASPLLCSAETNVFAEPGH